MVGQSKQNRVGNMFKHGEGLCLNPFQCGSLGSAHRAASGPIRPDNIGLFGPLPPGENTYPHSCGPIGEDHSLYGHVNC